LEPSGGNFWASTDSNFHVSCSNLSFADRQIAPPHGLGGKEHNDRTATAVHAGKLSLKVISTMFSPAAMPVLFLHLCTVPRFSHKSKWPRNGLWKAS
jgi:hypothetical protein